MSEQISQHDLEKLVLDAARKINLEHAAHTAPVYNLPEILALKNVTELRELGKVLQVKYYSKLPKPELILAIAESLQNEYILREYFYALDEVEWEFFQKVAAQKHLQTDKVFIDSYRVSQDIGLLQSFYHNDKLIFVVAREIKAVYQELLKTGFPDEKHFRDLLNKYAIAAVSLYGAISQDDFVALFNSQNDRQTSIDEVFSILLTYIHEDSEYCFWDEYIVDADFEDDDFKGVPDLVSARKNKPRYTPSRDELLKYSDWDYYEETPQLIALKQYLAELVADPDLVLDILDAIHDMCSTEVKMQEYFDFLDSVGIVFDSMEQARKMTQLIIDVQNNTRLWSNYGHTSRELSKSNLLPFPSMKTAHDKKVGRNDPCPCGSGKKYKKCCGR